MLISDNIYQVGYYSQEHPENTKYELFFASSDKNAMNYVNEWRKQQMTEKEFLQFMKCGDKK